jgi:hypothetical protein
MSKTKDKKQKAFLIIFVVLLFIASSFYLGVGLHKRENKPQVIKSPDFQGLVIDFTERFANDYFDGKAFLDPENQPVIDSYKEYLTIEKERILQHGISPLGGGVISFNSSLVIPEPEKGDGVFAVWLGTTINTREGIQKNVVFIARVKAFEENFIIQTAGAILGLEKNP